MFITVDFVYSDFVIDTIIDKYGGKNKFKKLNNDELTDSFKENLFSHIFAFYIGSDFTILCKSHMLQPYSLKEIIIRNIDSQNIEDIVESDSKYASGWTLSEMENTFAFAYRFAFKYYANSEDSEDNIRLRSIIEFIQVRYKKTHKINSIEKDNQWIKFSLNMMKINVNEDVLVALQNMQKNKRLELLFLLKILLNVTNDLIQKSEKSSEEVNSIISNMNEFFSQSEKMLKTSLSKENYDILCKKNDDLD